MAPHNDATWTDRQAVAEQLIPLVGALYRDNGVVTSIHGRRLINASPLQIVKAHRYARHVDGQELDINRTLELVQAIVALNPGPASINVAGILAEQAESGKSISDYAAEVLAPVAGKGKPATTEDAKDVVLYGFGRIGRLLARILLGNAENGRGPVLKAIVVRKGDDKDLTKRASLLRRDSVHGMFEGTISIDDERNSIIANGNEIRVIYADDPANVDYASYGINDALLIDNTGKWRDEAALSEHLKNKGIAKVLLTAPGKGDLPNVVYGVNHDVITADTKIVTAASCTTNAIVPALKVLNDAFGVKHGHVETVHSFTNDQNLIDDFHKGDRRGRSSAMNMVITETGAAKAVSKALPELEGKLSGNAIRVPTPDVSMAILNLTLKKAVDRDTLNKVLRDASLKSNLRNQIDYIESPEVVSTDFVGSNRAGIVDGLATIANGKNIILYVWYDNEYGYSHQVVRVIQELAGLHPPKFPSR